MEINNNLAQINPPLYAFLDSCLVEKGVKDIPDSLKEQMIQDLSQRLQLWLMQAVVMHLPEENALEFEQLMESGTEQEKIMEFLQSKVSNISQIFEQEMLNFKRAYLGN